MLVWTRSEAARTSVSGLCTVFSCSTADDDSRVTVTRIVCMQLLEYHVGINRVANLLGFISVT